MSKLRAEASPDMLMKAEQWSREADKEYAQADSEYEILKEHGKDLLAAMMTKIKEESEDKVSETALERMARALPEWRQFREGYFDALRKMNEAKYKSRNAQRFFDAVQSNLSFKRAEIKRLI